MVPAVPRGTRPCLDDADTSSPGLWTQQGTDKQGCCCLPFSFPISLFWTRDLHDICAYLLQGNHCPFSIKDRTFLTYQFVQKRLLLAQVKIKCLCLVLYCNTERWMERMACPSTGTATNEAPCSTGFALTWFDWQNSVQQELNWAKAEHVWAPHQAVPSPLSFFTCFHFSTRKSEIFLVFCTQCQPPLWKLKNLSGPGSHSMSFQQTAPAGMCVSLHSPLLPSQPCIQSKLV